MSYEIYDNFLDKNDFNDIKNIFLSNEFPWYYFNFKVYRDINLQNENKYNFQFMHTLYDNYEPRSMVFQYLYPLIKKINPASLIRIKANLTPVTDNRVTYDYHIDQSDIICKTAVYYINSNNGKTVFQNGNSVDSVENRLLVFNSDMLHAATTCTDEKVRCVLNLNYFERQ